MAWAKQATATSFLVGPILDADGVAVTDEVVGSIKVTKNGSVGAADAESTLTHNHTGNYVYYTDGDDMDTLGAVEFSLNSGTNAMSPVRFMVVPANVYDSLVGGEEYLQIDVAEIGASSATKSLLEDLVNNALGADDKILISTDGQDLSSTLDVNAKALGGSEQSATDLKDFADVGYDPSTHVAKADVTEWLGTTPLGLSSQRVQVDVRAIDALASAATVLGLWLAEGRAPIADSGTTTTLVDAMLSQGEGHWKGALLVFRSGTNTGRTAIVTDFNAGTNTLTFAPAMPDAVTTEDYVLVPGLGWSDVQAWHETLDVALLKGVFAGGCVWVDAGGTAGTTWPTGAAFQPTTTIASAKTIGDALGIDCIRVHGDHTLAAPMEGYLFIGHGHVEYAERIDANSHSIEHSIFEKLVIQGTGGNAAGVTNMTRYTNCALWAHTNINGMAVDCGLAGACSILDTGTAIFKNVLCGALAACTLTLQAPVLCDIVNMTGELTLAGMDGGVCSVSMQNGASLIIDGSCTSGVITITGSGTVTGAGGGCTVNITTPEADTVRLSGDSDEADNLAAAAGTMVTGTVDDTVSPTTTMFEAADITEATEDHFKGRVVIFRTGALAKQTADITAYELNGGRGKFTVVEMTEAAADGDTFIIV